jgi:hypothetical protein
MLDSQTLEAIIELEKCLVILLSHYDTLTFQMKRPTLCKLLADVTKIHQNYPKIIRYIPLTTQRGKELQTSLSFYILCKLLEKEIPEV